MPKIISGKDIAENIIQKDLIPRVQKLNKAGIQPKLIVILVGDHAASASYVRQKERFAEEAGILSEVWRYDADVTQTKILGEIERINADPTIHGVIVQLPLPDHISVEKVLRAIHPSKDVDGFTAENVGKLFLGELCLQCCTPKGIIRMIEEAGYKLEGQNVTVVGRSNIVGKPVAALAMNKNATVKVCHSKTRDLRQELQNQDIIIVAVGRPEMIKADDIPEGCVIIDVGIHRKDDGKLCGDVDFEDVKDKVEAISPVPGGVGPMTVVSLIENTIQSAESDL